MSKSFKKKSIVSGSPAIQEHEAMMSQINSEAATVSSGFPAVESTPVIPPAGNQRPSVFSAMTTEPMKNVQTRIPLSTYEKLNRMKYFAGQRTSIGDIVAQAIDEYVERHPVQ